MMDSGLLFFSLLAGMLTVLTPCVLPLLPVIIGGSLLDSGRKWRAVIITGSLALSVIAFTLILKLSTSLIAVPPQFWQGVSGGIVVLFGLVTLFPKLWTVVEIKLGLSRASDQVLVTSANKSGWLGSVLLGVSLGPVFSSCSPTYALILATVLPANFTLGMTYLLLYTLGLAGMLLLAALLGQGLLRRLRWAINPFGWFRRGLGALLILVGLLIVIGLDKRLQSYLLDVLPLDATKLELAFLEKEGSTNQVGMNVLIPYTAPSIQGISHWINSSPLNLEELRGKVVLIDFWTYSCINCIRTIPFLNDWHQRYKDEGLVIIGVHAPEFAFEKVAANVQTAVDDYRIEYPVALDNDFSTWQAYKNRFWPAKYFIDRDGRVRHTHFGEGKYRESEAVIRQLLAEGGEISVEAGAISADLDRPPIRRDQTPETYLGWRRGDNFRLQPSLRQDESVNYQLETVGLHQWSLGGDWEVNDYSSVSRSDASRLRLRFAAKEVYLVLSSDEPAELTLSLNGQPLTADNGGGSDVTTDGKVPVREDRLYRLVNLSEFVSGAELEIIVPNGVSINAFTFGS